MHDVDEDLMTVSTQGGRYASKGGTAGIVYRYMYDSIYDHNDTVASMCSFNYGYAYIITLIVNELIEDNSVKESIVH